MALTYDLSTIKDYKTVCFDEGEDGGMKPATHSIIFATMAVGIGDLTEKNAPEFYARLHLYERMVGAFLVKMDDGKRVDVPFTPEDVRAHIGLRTNVGPVETRSKWLKRVTDRTLSDALYVYNQATEKAVA